MGASGRLSAVLFVAAALLAGVPRAARSQQPPPVSERTGTAKPASLSWTRLDGAADCIGTRDLALAVETLVGHAVFVSASQAELSIEGRIDRRPGGFRALVTVSSKTGQVLGSRDLSIDGADCRTLDEPVTLAIALMVDPDAALAGRPASPPPAPAGNAEPRVVERRVEVYVPVRVRGNEPAPARPPAWQGDVFGGGAVGAGYLPRPSAAAVAGASLEPPSFVPLEAVLTVFFPQEHDAPSGAVVSFFSAKVGGFICPLAARGAVFAGRLCGGLDAGLIAASGKGFDVDGGGVRGQVAVAARARLSARLMGPLAVAAAVAASVPMTRDRFVYHDASGQQVELFRVSPVAAQGDLGFELRFP